MVLQAAIEAERAKTQDAFEERDQQLAERDRQAVERDRENEERTSRLLKEERNRNDSANRAMYDLFVVSFFCILAKSCTQCSFHYN